MSAHEQIELLIGAAQLEVRLQSHRVIALHERVQKLVHADGCARLKAIVKIIALHHARHGVLGCKLNHAHGAQRQTPLGVVANFSFAGI